MAGLASAAQPARLGSLPDELLIEVLRFLKHDERHAALPLVSRRWRQLVTSPQLLRSISVEVPRPGALKRTLALGGWLARVAAPHVEQLDVLLDPGADARILHADDLTDPTPVLTALVAGAAACSGLQRLRLNLPRSWLHDCSCACLLALPAGLQQLSISTSRVTIWEFPPGWSAAFTNLRRLVLQAAGGVSYIQPVQWAPAGLQELALDGPVKFHRNVAGFPASLTKVCLARVHAVPNQLTSLTGLQELSICNMSYCSTGYSLLTRLGSLRRLKLTQCKLPACLSQLTWLRALQLTALEESAANWEALETGLRTLASLTHLAFEVPRCDAKPPACPRMPPTLQGLTNLRRLHWDAAVAAPQNPALPAGPWLSSLQRLALPLETAAANLRLLQSAAPQLEWLGIPRWRARARGSASASGWELRMLRSLLRSAGQLAAGSLHTLRVDFGNPLPGQKAAPLPSWWAEEAAALRSRHVSLQDGAIREAIFPEIEEVGVDD